MQYVDRNKAFSIYQELVRFRYPAAFDNLGWLYIMDQNNEALAITYFRAGTDLGDPDSMVSLAEMIIKGKTQPRGPNDTVIDLYCRAAQLGHIEAMKGCQRAKEANNMPIGPRERFMLELFRGFLRNIPQHQ